MRTNKKAPENSSTVTALIIQEFSRRVQQLEDKGEIETIKSLEFQLSCLRAGNEELKLDEMKKQTNKLHMIHNELINHGTMLEGIQEYMQVISNSK